MADVFELMWKAITETGRKFTLEEFIMDDRWRTVESVKIANSESVSWLVMELLRNELISRKLVPSEEDEKECQTIMEELITSANRKEG